MTIHLGTDIVYIPRIQATLNRFGARFLQRVYTLNEQNDYKQLESRQENCSSEPNRASIYYLAGRWAAKEAVVKALGTGFAGVRYTDIEIQRHPSGVPQVHLYQSAVTQMASWGSCNWQLSLSHDGDYCVATAIAFCTPSLEDSTQP